MNTEAKTQIKNWNRLPVSDSIYREFGSHHSILITSKKQNRLKNQQLSGSVRGVRTQPKLLPPRLKRQTGNTGRERTLDFYSTWTASPRWATGQEKERKGSPNGNEVKPSLFADAVIVCI